MCPVCTASPKESHQRKGDPQSATPSLCEGANLRRGGCGVRRGTRFALRAPLRHPRRVRARSTRAPTRVPPRNRLAAGAASRGWDSRTSQQPHGPLLRSAQAAQRVALAPAIRGRAQRWPVWMFCTPVPLWMRRGAQGLADQGSRVSERRAAARVERDPAKPEHRRWPRSVSAGDADSGVALSLVPLFRRRERKGLACRATPGLRPQPRHRDRFIHKLQQPPSGIAECRRSAIKYVAVKA